MVRTPLTLAAAASWRYALLQAAAVGVGALPGTLVLRVLDAPSAALTLAALPAVAAGALLAHEYAHVRAFAWAGGRLGDLEARGTWVRASLERPALPWRRDVIVSVSGPTAGMCVAMIPAFAQRTLVAWILFGLLALFHLISLLPPQADFASIRSAVTGALVESLSERSAS